MFEYEFSARIASKNTFLIIGKQPFLRLDEFYVHESTGHPNGQTNARMDGQWWLTINNAKNAQAAKILGLG